MSKDHQQKLSHDNVTRTYQKATPKLEASINLEVWSISKISERVEHIATTYAFVTLKDHKYNFCSNPMCRLINPSKTNMEKWVSNLWKK